MHCHGFLKGLLVTGVDVTVTCVGTSCEVLWYVTCTCYLLCVRAQLCA